MQLVCLSLTSDSRVRGGERERWGLYKTKETDRQKRKRERERERDVGDL